MSVAPPPESVQARILQHVTAGDTAAATSLVLQHFGGEVGGYLASRLPHGDDAADVLSLWTEDVWRGLEGFRGDSHIRTWLYVLARNALSRFVRKEQRHVKGAVAWSDAPHVSALVAKLRTTTALFLQTAVKDEVRALRALLSDDEQDLLTLRIDRQLEWVEVANILFAELPAPERTKKVPTLRKRLERTKDKLRHHAQAKGLL